MQPKLYQILMKENYYVIGYVWFGVPRVTDESHYIQRLVYYLFSYVLVKKDLYLDY